jgi:hypothetical protein
MANADANQGKLSFKQESSFNETPGTSLTLKNLPFTDESLQYDKQTVVSNEVRSDRNVQDLVEVGVNVEGPINFELSTYSEWFSSFLLAVLMGAKTDNNDVALDDAYSVADSGLTESDFTGGDADAPPLGRAILFDDLFSGDGRVAAIVRDRPDADTFTVSPQMNDTGTIDAGAVYDYSEIKNGSTVTSFFIEKYFNDLSVGMGFSGCRVDSMTLNFVSREILTGSMNIIGGNGFASDEGVYTVSTRDENSGSPYSASANVGAIVAGSNTAPIKRATLEIRNNLRGQDAIGSKFFNGVGTGRFEVSGTIEAYFNSLTMFNVMKNHGSISIILGVQLGTTALAFYIPAAKLAKAMPNIEGISTDVMIPLEFQGIYDSTEDATIVVSEARALSS